MIDWLDEREVRFPPLDKALVEPDGLLAAGGNLSPDTLIQAYRKGIFPWFNDDDPILWWSPSQRALIALNDFHVSRSLKRSRKKLAPTIFFDTNFETVIENCGSNRPEGTWITPEMRRAYIEMHERGFAHSCEVVIDNKLCAAIYGIAMHPFFFGESMYTTVTDGSKIAMWALVERLQSKGYSYIDCQMSSTHLKSLGAKELPRAKFEHLLKQICITTDIGRWNEC